MRGTEKGRRMTVRVATSKRGREKTIRRKITRGRTKKRGRKIIRGRTAKGGRKIIRGRTKKGGRIKNTAAE